jgi:hypothetical protein
MEAYFRDHVGNLVANFTQRQYATLLTVEGEVWTLLLAMKEVNHIHRGWHKVQFESDSHVLAEATRTRRSSNSKFSLIVENIQIILSCVNFEVEFIMRQANMVVHILTQVANSWTSFHKFEIILLCIKRLLINKMH